MLCGRAVQGRTFILDEFVTISGCHGKHAITLLREYRGWRSTATPIQWLHKRLCGDEENRVVLSLADFCDTISLKRLRAAPDTELSPCASNGTTPSGYG
ncbi:MAG: hypothetical protein M1546_18590 [Chloroflexi bacterium]|nr:hypothetical protein [Chloroflexota bacterium]